jgi:hypothetical protein
MRLNIRRTCTVVEDKHEYAGRKVAAPVRKVAVIVVLENPYAGQAVEDLGPLTSGSVSLGEMMGDMAVQALGDYKAQSYGKGALVGINGEIEHASALVTTAFANPIRAAIGGGKAWISSMVKVSAPGGSIDIPMNHKDEVYVRSHYDAMTVVMQETPMADEIAIIFCLASEGRIGARVGGMTHADVLKRDAQA